jgi:SAM-dependent methyltransferase
MSAGRYFSIQKVLDVGCNTGRGGAVLKRGDQTLQIYGLDCVPERVEKLSPSVYVEGYCGFSTDIPLPDRSMDAILGGEFLEHVPPSDVEKTLCEFFRVLRLHGRLILTTPNPSYLKNSLKGLSVLLDQSHLTQHYPDCLKHRLRCVGFSAVRIYGSGRVSRYLGQRFPFLGVYGSYLIVGQKW